MKLLSLPSNVLRQALRDVYFIFGDGRAVADEIGRKHGMQVYHTCDHRHRHRDNADPALQPAMSRYAEDIPDYFAQDPEEAMRTETAIVREFTPMAVLDLIRLSAQHGRVICENDLDIESLVPCFTHAVTVQDSGAMEQFVRRFERHIRGRAIPEGEKERLMRGLRPAVDRCKREPLRLAERHGAKPIAWSADSTVERTAEAIAELFGLEHAAFPEKAE